MSEPYYKFVREKPYILDIIGIKSENHKPNSKNNANSKSNIVDIYYAIHLLVSRDNTVAWMPDNEEQHVNPLYRDSERRIPLTVDSIKYTDIRNMIATIYSIVTKNNDSLEIIASKYGIEKQHDSLIREILKEVQDLSSNSKFVYSKKRK